MYRRTKYEITACVRLVFFFFFLIITARCPDNNRSNRTRRRRRKTRPETEKKRNRSNTPLCTTNIVILYVYARACVYLYSRVQCAYPCGARARVTLSKQCVLHVIIDLCFDHDRSRNDELRGTQRAFAMTHIIIHIFGVPAACVVYAYYTRARTTILFNASKRDVQQARVTLSRRVSFVRFVQERI